MARPRIAPGERGAITVTRRSVGVFVAYARYRRHDGVLRTAEVQGPTKAAATANLKARIRERLGDTDGGLSADTTVAALAGLWLEARAAEGLAPNTMASARGAVDRLVVPMLGGLTIRQCTAPRVERAMRTLLSSDSPSNAGRLRWVLSGMFSIAVRLGAATADPVAHTTVYRPAPAEPRALTIEELGAVRAALSGSPAADVFEFLAATGCRPAEALGLHWSDVHLDDLRPWVSVRQQVVRVKGEGLVLTPTKGKDTRNLVLPAFAVDMLRGIQRDEGPVFPGVASGGLQDPRDVRTAWDAALKGTDFEWVTQRTIRRTVATLVAEGDGVALAARQLGHRDDRVTRKHYIQPDHAPLAVGSMSKLA